MVRWTTQGGGMSFFAMFCYVVGSVLFLIGSVLLMIKEMAP